MEMGIDVFPYHFPFGSHLKHPPEHSFSNQGITVREPAGSGYIRAEEVVERVVMVFPHYAIGFRLDFDYPRERQRDIFAMRTVVKDEHVTVVEHAGVVLLSEDVI